MSEPVARDGAERETSSVALWSWAFYDWASSAFAAVIATFVFAAYFTRQVAPSEAAGSFLWGWMLGLSGIATGIFGPILGAVADRGGRNKSWIAVCTLACIVAMASLWFIRPSSAYLWPALLLVAIGVMTSEFAAAILVVASLTLFWTFGMLLSLFVGPLQAASRSYLARTAPEALRNEAFGLYAHSGKATAFLGPLMVGSLTSLADSQRVGMSVLVVFFLAGFLLMLKVPEANPG